MPWLPQRSGPEAPAARHRPRCRPSLEELEKRHVPSITFLDSPPYSLTATPGQLVTVGVGVSDTDPAASRIDVYFNWGDGTLSLVSVPHAGLLDVADGTHTYASPGSYAVTISAVDDGSSGTFASDPASRLVTVKPARVSPVPTPPPAAPAVAPLSDVSGQVQVALRKRTANPAAGSTTLQLTLSNASGHSLQGPLFLVVEGLRHKVKLRHATGVSGTHSPGSPYIALPLSALNPGQAVTLTLRFSGPSGQTIRMAAFQMLVLAGQGQP
jgi:hypothetical protein